MSKHGNPQSKAPESAERMDRMSIRLEEADITRLEAAVKKYRQDTGLDTSTSGFARTLILIGLQNFERTGALVITS